METAIKAEPEDTNDNFFANMNSMSPTPCLITRTKPQAHTRTSTTNAQLPTPNSPRSAAELDNSMTEDTYHEEGEEDDLPTLGNVSRRLIQLMHKLVSLNIDTTLQSLPKIVVVGDQSAGKSSIIEALCRVNVPRSAGTCTRCPFQITTKAGRHWECKVSLQIRYKYDSTNNGTGLYANWTEQKLEIIPFARVSNKRDLTDILIKAQSTLLNPSNTVVPYELQPLNGNERPEVGFSPNIISLSITGPALNELSFYDLPGSINVVEDANDQHLVEFVELLVKSYIRDEKALIMVACPADIDTENSTTLKFIMSSGAQHRCLGVLTKPDLLQNQRMPQIARMLQGNGFKLGRGWYVTKQPTQDQLQVGVTPAMARRQEADFFDASPDLHPYLDQCGIANLETAVSTELREHILASLPGFTENVKARIAKLDAELKTFKPADNHPMMTVVSLMARIGDSVEAHIKGGNNGIVKFREDYERTKTLFRKTLLDQAPVFIPTTPGFKPSENAITLEDSDIDDTPTPPPPPPSSVSSSSRKRKAGPTPVTPQSAPAKRVKNEGNTGYKPVQFTIEDVQTIQNTFASRGFTGVGDTRVTSEIIQRSMAGWPKTLDRLKVRVEQSVHKMIFDIIKHELVQYKSCLLYDETIIVARDYIKPFMDSVNADIDKLLARELYEPGTSCPMTMHVNVAKDMLNKLRSHKRANEAWDQQEAKGGKVLNIEQRAKLLNDDKIMKDFKSDSDPHESVVTALVHPFAYYSMLADRFVDTVAVVIEYELLRVLRSDFKDVLNTGVGSNDLNTCHRLVAEDQQREAARQELEAERGRLLVALDDLKDAPNLTE